MIQIISEGRDARSLGEVLIGRVGAAVEPDGSLFTDHADIEVVYSGDEVIHPWLEGDGGDAAHDYEIQWRLETVRREPNGADNSCWVATYSEVHGDVTVRGGDAE